MEALIQLVIYVIIFAIFLAVVVVSYIATRPKHKPGQGPAADGARAMSQALSLRLGYVGQDTSLQPGEVPGRSRMTRQVGGLTLHWTTQMQVTGVWAATSLLPGKFRSPRLPRFHCTCCRLTSWEQPEMSLR